MEEKLLFSDYILKALDFEEHPEDPIKEQILKEYLDKVIIRNYIPLKEKELVMVNIMNGVNKDFDAPGRAAFLEMSKTVSGLLAYCVNIENDVSLSTIMYSINDVCWQYGLSELVLKYCSTDYEKLCNMVDSALRFENLETLIKTASLFSQEELDKWEKSIKELETHLNSEQFKALNEYTASNDVSGVKLLSQIQEEAVSEVNQEIAKEKELLQKAIDKVDSNKVN